MNVNKLKGKITERGLNVEKLATLIGVERSRLYRHIKNNKLTIKEASKIKGVLELTDTEASDIFFN